VKSLAAFPWSRPLGAVVSSLSRVLRCEWPLIGIGLVALVLRGHQLLEQVPIDDEWHALSQSMGHPLGEILTQFGINDISIPIAVYYRVLIATIGLTSWELRLPFLFFGLATVVGFPLMVRPIVGRSAANILAALLSVSPILIFFSRFARPYAIALFCSLSAAMAFRAWWNSGLRRWATAYVGLAAFACWLVMIVAPFVLGSFVLVPATDIPDTRRAVLGRLMRLGSLTLLALAVLIGPPIWFDGGSVFSKVNALTIRPIDLYRGAVFALGNGEEVLATGMIVLAAIGMVALFIRQPRFAGHLAGLAALQVVGFIVASPNNGQQANVSSRYLLPVLSVTLMFSAVGIVAVGDAFGRTVSGWLRPVLGSAVCGAVLWYSPVALIAASPNDWASHYLGQSFTEWHGGFYVNNVRPVPLFYETLASLPPGSAPIVEVPDNGLTFWNPLPYYQRIHRQPIQIGMINGLIGPVVWGEVPYGHAGISLQTNVFLSDLETMRHRGARYVIVHRDLYGETKIRPYWIPKSIDMEPCIEWLTRKLGAPVFEGPSIVVFELSNDRSE